MLHLNERELEAVKYILDEYINEGNHEGKDTKVFFSIDKSNPLGSNIYFNIGDIEHDITDYNSW